MWRRLFGIAIHLIAILEMRAQPNLVLNGDFESYTICPFSGSFGVVLDDWSVQAGSPDYFNSCHGGDWGIPNNRFGFQDEDSGASGYMGVGTYSPMFLGASEIAKGILNQDLLNGIKYRVRFKISIAENLKYSTCCIGIILSDQPPPNPPYQTNISDIELVIPVAEYDTTPWYQLDTTYTAIGGEDKIYIGCFRPESEMEVVLSRPNAQWPNAYFYIDDVEVYEDDTITGMEDNQKPQVAVWYDANSQAILSKGGPVNANIRVHDAAGRMVASGQGNLSTSGLQGFYVVQVIDPNGEILTTQKIVVP